MCERFTILLCIKDRGPSPDPRLANTLQRYPSVLSVLFCVSGKCQMWTQY